MKIKNYTEVSKNFKAGDEIWACAFNYTHDKEGKHLYQEPVFGKLMAGKTEVAHNSRIERFPDSSNVEYFVPFKKNGVDLAWSKAVLMYNRYYATTEEECVELYNSLVKNAIDWHRSEIEALEKLVLA